MRVAGPAAIVVGLYIMGVTHRSSAARRPSRAGRVVIAAAGLALVACLPELASLEDRECDAEGRCAEGWVCDPAQNLCVRELDDPPPECVLDQDCQGEAICVDGECETPVEPPECTTNDDCPGEQVCLGGECREPQVVPECEDDGDCPADEICLANQCVDPDTPPPPCTDGALRACDLTTGEPVTGPACEAGLQYCRTADLTWSDCAAAELMAPELELDGEAADGALVLEAGESVIVPIYDRFDPRAGTVAGEDFRWWVQGRLAHIPGSRTGSRIGTEGTGATVELEEGLHLVVLEVTDPCGSQAVVPIRVQVGTTFDRALPGESVGALCFTEADQAPPVAVAGTGEQARSLDGDLVEDAAHTRAGRTVRACAIGPTRTHVAWDDGTITRHVLDNFNQGGAGPNSVQPMTDPGAGEILRGGVVLDGHDRFWRLRGGRLAYNDGTGLTYVEGPFSAPGHAGGGWTANALAYDGAGGLWVGTSEGLNRLDVSGADAGSFAWRWNAADVDVLGLAGGPSGGAVTAVAASPGGVWATGDGWAARVVRLPGGVLSPTAGDLEVLDLQAGPDVGWAPRILNTFVRLKPWGDGEGEEIVLGGQGGVVRVAWSQVFSGSDAPVMWLRLMDTPAADLAARPRNGEWHLLSATSDGVARYRGR
jgi:hypothetical protein